MSTGSESGDSDEDEDEGVGLPSAVETPIKELIQQQLETFAADKTVSASLCINLWVVTHVSLETQSWRHC